MNLIRDSHKEKVKEFEMEWSKYLGCSHSTFVKSGAQQLHMASMMKEKKGVGEVIVSPLGWVSDVLLWLTWDSHPCS
ncbi:MAG: hypothetical protein CM15mL4_2880 [uncultured marine virus]|nr:MAG: hypothetical protein CM15mL4_2880 [uncultured marine virus]